MNERITRETEDRVSGLAAQPRAIERDLKELDAERDIERAIEMNASALAFIGTALGYVAHPCWLVLPALVTAFLFQHAVQSWCPPVPVLRHFGFRTVCEIAPEKQALKAVRGDYDPVEQATDRAAAALRAAGR